MSNITVKKCYQYSIFSSYLCGVKCSWYQDVQDNLKLHILQYCEFPIGDCAFFQTDTPLTNVPEYMTEVDDDFFEDEALKLHIHYPDEEDEG